MNRIAVHVLYDFCLPLQNGMPDSIERKDSNEQIKKVLEEHECDFSDVLDSAGYFIPQEWYREKDIIIFCTSEGKWEKVPTGWVIFEEENPALFGLWSSGRSAGKKYLRL